MGCKLVNIQTPKKFYIYLGYMLQGLSIYDLIVFRKQTYISLKPWIQKNTPWRSKKRRKTVQDFTAKTLIFVFSKK